MSALLSLEQVSKTFTRGGLLSRRTIEAVKGVSFALQADKPEIFAVIGESGSGKSTLARMILGMHKPSAGRLLFEGRDVAALTPAEKPAFMARVQPIFQNPFEAFNPLKQLDFYLFMTARRFGGAPPRRRPKAPRTPPSGRSACRSARSGAASRTSSPVASCSGSRSPGRSSRSHASSSPTSPSRWSTPR